MKFCWLLIFSTAIVQAQKLKPEFSVILSEKIHETSGLVYTNGGLWTHNDDADTNLYQLDTVTGKITDFIFLPNVKNKDWEEIDADENYFYVGDFGNNVRGNRRNLQVLRVDKISKKIDTIAFQYSNQENFLVVKSNKTDFDGEAFVVTANNIFIFTKQWKSKKTAVYQLPKTPGNFVAKRMGEINVEGLITGATLVNKTLVLCGYNKKVKPFLFFVYDFDENFSDCKTKKIKLKLPFHQVEGIASTDGKWFYFTNEKLEIQPFINVKAKLHKIDLSKFLLPE
ncbi:T9SS C-terminal target domain-containing protein [Flavobacterium sp. NST-5]|uniref:T9SS C-terminal target domain-containing protein n=1 Tax=Flavobacterium ichthyis TaxID=2698827 RepID=A0ABW9Z8R6_9FLAO|nr:T9SS C-terminal target domain-containing protein [Flavobacterium ichthyis]NBL65253.1 T9SS C-terminal target domain-containing protein [Flavobacterium ichthyis]